jgi:hypothetical protein
MAHHTIKRLAQMAEDLGIIAAALERGGLAFQASRVRLAGRECQTAADAFLHAAKNGVRITYPG